MEYFTILVALYLCVFLPLLRAGNITAKRIATRKKRNGGNMIELVQKFIGKKCVICMFDNSFGETYLVKECVGNGILVQDKSGAERLLNLDYVVQLREQKEKHK